MSDHRSTDYSFRLKDGVLGAQMLFVAFGALVLVPLLTGLDPNVALFTAGVGTLIFQIVTRGQVPIFLASSFAFIAPIIYGVQTWGIPGTLCGLVAAGVVYMLLSLFIRLRGIEVVTRVLPPIVTGPVIMVIGLILAPVAVNLAMGRTGDGADELVPQATAMTVAVISLVTTLLVSLLGRGFFGLVPILSGIVAGYIVSIPFGLIDMSGVHAAAWITVPDFVMPEWNWQAILFMVPVAIAPAIEHFGDVLAIRSVTGKDYLKNPGVDRTMLGDGLATSFAGMLGGPPNTTYSEVTGAVTLIKVYNPGLMTWAALLAIAFAFVGKLGALLQSIPTPVMGGIIILLFGAIIVVGMNSLVKAGENLTRPRNLSIVGIILVTGIGGMSLSAGEFTLEGIALAAVLGVVLNLVLPQEREEEEG
ncbi:MAG: uracil-xanthine permease family protein [Gammaproteobacteria bacterium]|nr:uracil-xanthine permease family protein [Gammaproteobacteria bacterium]